MIVLAYDHGAYPMFQKIKEYLNKNKIEYIECASKEYDGMDSFATMATKANNYVNPLYLSNHL